MAIDPDIDFNIDRPENGGDWTELIGNESPWTMHFKSFGDAQFSTGAVLEGDATWCPYDQWQDCLLRILGYATRKNVGGTDRLHRQLPVRCPQTNWLFCIGADVQGIKFKEVNDETPDDSPPCAVYERAKITPYYSQLPFRLREDDEVSDETERYIYRQPEALCDILAFDFGTNQFVEGKFRQNGTKGSVGQVALIVPKMRMAINWYQVPEAYIFSKLGGLKMPNIQKCMGKVNTVKFLDCDPGTLLMEAPSLSDQYTAPIPVKNDNDPQFYFNVKLNLLNYDPDRNPNIPIPAGQPEWKYRGHNLAPGPDRYHYAVQSAEYDNGDGTTTLPQPIYQGADFNDIFKPA